MRELNVAEVEEVSGGDGCHAAVVTGIGATSGSFAAIGATVGAASGPPGIAVGFLAGGLLGFAVGLAGGILVDKAICDHPEGGGGNDSPGRDTSSGSGFSTSPAGATV